MHALLLRALAALSDARGQGSYAKCEGKHLWVLLCACKNRDYTCCAMHEHMQPWA